MMVFRQIFGVRGGGGDTRKVKDHFVELHVDRRS